MHALPRRKNGGADEGAQVCSTQSEYNKLQPTKEGLLEEVLRGIDTRSGGAVRSGVAVCA